MVDRLGANHLAFGVFIPVPLQCVQLFSLLKLGGHQYEQSDWPDSTREKAPGGMAKALYGGERTLIMSSVSCSQCCHITVTFPKHSALEETGEGSLAESCPGPSAVRSCSRWTREVCLSHPNPASTQLTFHFVSHPVRRTGVHK